MTMKIADPPQPVNRNMTGDGVLFISNHVLQVGKLPSACLVAQPAIANAPTLTATVVTGNAVPTLVDQHNKLLADFTTLRTLVNTLLAELRTAGILVP